MAIEYEDLELGEDEEEIVWEPQDPEMEAMVAPLVKAAQAIAASPQFAALDIDQQSDFLFCVREACLQVGIQFDEALHPCELEIHELSGASSEDEEAGHE